MNFALKRNTNIYLVQKVAFQAYERYDEYKREPSEIDRKNKMYQVCTGINTWWNENLHVKNWIWHNCPIGLNILLMYFCVFCYRNWTKITLKQSQYDVAITFLEEIYIFNTFRKSNNLWLHAINRVLIFWSQADRLKTQITNTHFFLGVPLASDTLCLLSRMPEIWEQSLI